MSCTINLSKKNILKIKCFAYLPYFFHIIWKQRYFFLGFIKITASFDWLVFNANFNSISALSWCEQNEAITIIGHVLYAFVYNMKSFRPFNWSMCNINHFNFLWAQKVSSVHNYNIHFFFFGGNHVTAKKIKPHKFELYTIFNVLQFKDIKYYEFSNKLKYT